MTTVASLPKLIFEKTKIVPANVFEIGAADGSDADYLRTVFSVPFQNVFCFEPDPTNFTKLTTQHPQFNSFRLAVSDQSGKATFHCHGPAADVSSLKIRTNGYPYSGSPDKNYTPIQVDVIRMDDFLNRYKIDHVDVCKVDTEGFSFNVLGGFGDRLNSVKCFHLEAEKIPLFDGAVLFPEIRDFMVSRGYSLIDYVDHAEICDSVWARKDMVK